MFMTENLEVLNFCLNQRQIVPVRFIVVTYDTCIITKGSRSNLVRECSVTCAEISYIFLGRYPTSNPTPATQVYTKESAFSFILFVAGCEQL